MNRKNPVDTSNDKMGFSTDELRIIRLSFSYRYRIDEALNKY